MLGNYFKARKHITKYGVRSKSFVRMEMIGSGGMFHMNHNLYPSRLNSGGYPSSESTYIPSGLLGSVGDELGCDDLGNGPSTLTLSLPPAPATGTRSSA